MKKFLFLLVETLSMLILVLLGILVLKPMYVNAQALPQVSQYTFEVIEGGMQDAVSIGSQYKGLSPYTDSLIATYEIMGALFYEYENLTGDSAGLWFCDSDDVIVRSLNSSEVAYFENKPLFDRLGQVVDSSNVFYCSYNNGFFSGGCYLDSNGDVLYESYELNAPYRALANIAYGGSLVEWSDWNNFYTFVRSEASENQLNFSFSDVDYSDLSYFNWCGYLSSNYSGNIKQVSYVFVPNCCDLGNIICGWVGGTYQNRFYYNNSANWVHTFENIGDSTSTNYLINYFNGSQNYDGYSYSNLMEINRNAVDPSLGAITNFSYSDFVSYNPAFGESHYYIFASNISPDLYDKYTQILNNDINITSFVPLQFPNGAVVNPSPIPNELIDLGSISELGDLSEVQPELNPDFDPLEVIDPSNFPEFVELPTSFPSPSSLPNNVNNVDPNPNPENQPSIGENIGDVGGINLPFIDNLKNRFPFSIPFDIYDLVSGLSVQREAPSFEWDIYLPIINYHWVVDFDLSSWNNQASIFRTCFLILFIISLAMWSYNHFFGS